MGDKASEAARILGSIRSKKKAAASRENGKLGGRPANRYCQECGESYAPNSQRVYCKKRQSDFQECGGEIIPPVEEA